MILYALTILVSAFLLFQVQPVIAKIILPWFGGSAAVWTTCLLFFQMVLLLGLSLLPRGHPLSQTARRRCCSTSACWSQACRAAHLPQHVVETGGRRRTHPADPRTARRHHRAALFPALHHRTAAAGMVRAPLQRRHALPALRALQRRLHVRPDQLPGAVRTHFHHPPAIRYVELELMAFLSSCAPSRPSSRTGPWPTC